MSTSTFNPYHGRPNLNIGIALFHHLDHRGRLNPHWAIIAHEDDYFGRDARIFQIARDETSNWVLRHNTRTVDREDRTLIGIINVGSIMQDRGWLENFASQFPAGKNGSDPGALNVWCGAAWVIRFLWGLVLLSVLTLPVPIYEFFGYAKKTESTVIETRQLVPNRVAVVNLV
ncbi:hypothetical protein Moror_16676 [Moniliophthora roreri MCA 2997]|uniref:Uncharacterized protein n=2 Tax=Moniliophthora roreri TaxID=221103 RepID=V2WXD2_MONRO|nr:hypothetical protein Moror_16676 [Moniliophthora roreri MCA 2997]